MKLNADAQPAEHPHRPSPRRGRPWAKSAWSGQGHPAQRLLRRPGADRLRIRQPLPGLPVLHHYPRLPRSSTAATRTKPERLITQAQQAGLTRVAEKNQRTAAKLEEPDRRPRAHPRRAGRHRRPTRNPTRRRPTRRRPTRRPCRRLTTPATCSPPPAPAPSRPAPCAEAAIAAAARAGQPSTVVAIAHAAAASRSWLYTQPDLIDAIGQLQQRRPAPDPLRAPTRHRPLAADAARGPAETQHRAARRGPRAHRPTRSSPRRTSPAPPKSPPVLTPAADPEPLPPVHRAARHRHVHAAKLLVKAPKSIKDPHSQRTLEALMLRDVDVLPSLIHRPQPLLPVSGVLA